MLPDVSPAFTIGGSLKGIPIASSLQNVCSAIGCLVKDLEWKVGTGAGSGEGVAGNMSLARSVYSKTKIRQSFLGQCSDGSVSFQDYSYSPDTPLDSSSSVKVIVKAEKYKKGPSGTAYGSI